MAVRISKDITTRFKIVNLYTDGTSDEVVLGCGDRVEDLKFVNKDSVESVTGKIVDLRLTTSTTIDWYNNLVSGKTEDILCVKEFVVDSSEVEHAKKVVVPAFEVLEYNADSSKEIKQVKVVPKIDVNVTLKNGNVVSFSEGDTFSGVETTITRFPMDIKVDGFMFNFDKRINLIKPVGIAEFTAKPKKYIRFKEIVSVASEDIMKVTISSPEAAMEVFNNLQGGEEIYFETDVEVEDTIQIPEGIAVTLNLGDHKLTVPAANPSTGRSKYAIDNYGDLTITGGTIEARGIENFGTMTIEDIDITAVDGNGGAAVWNEGDLTINGGIYKTIYEGSTKDSSGPGCLNNHSGTCVINGGEFRSVNKRTYAIINKADITISENASIIVNGVHGGLCVDSGHAVVNGGTYVSTEFYGLYVSNDGTGTPETAQVIVNGGEFTGNVKSVWIGSDTGRPVDSVIDINGGIFNNPMTVQSNVVEGAGIKVSGGLFKDPVPENYCLPGYMCSEEPNEDGYYTIVEKPVNGDDPAEENL